MKSNRFQIKRGIFPARLLGIFLIASIAIGNSPAWALRPIDAPETNTAAQLQRRLQPPAGQEEDFKEAIDRLEELSHRLDPKEDRREALTTLDGIAKILIPSSRLDAQQHFPDDLVARAGEITLNIFMKTLAPAAQETWKGYPGQQSKRAHFFIEAFLGIQPVSEPEPYPQWVHLRQKSKIILNLLLSNAKPGVRKDLNRLFSRQVVRVFRQSGLGIQKRNPTDQLRLQGVIVTKPMSFSQFKVLVRDISQEESVELAILGIRTPGRKNPLVWIDVEQFDTTTPLFQTHVFAQGHSHWTDPEDPAPEKIVLSGWDTNVYRGWVSRSSGNAFVVQWMPSTRQLHVAVLRPFHERWKYYEGDEQAERVLVDIGIIKSSAAPRADGPKRPGAGQEESHEARAERIIKETAGWIDQNIRSQVYGHGPLVVSGRGALRIGSEVSAKEWNRIYPVDFVADRVIGPNGFYEDGYSCSDAAVFIAEHLRSEFQKAGIPAVVLVRVGRTSIWAKDFFVVVQLGSSRWIFSGTPEMPTLGASFLRVDDQIVYTPDEWHYLRRSNYITLHSGEGRRLAIPMYWIPLDENHVLSINAGIDPGDGRLVEPRDPDTLDGLNKPFELFFQTSVFRLEPPEDLFGRVVLIRIPKGRLKELRGALRADRQADFLNWLREAREAGVTVKDYFYGNHSVGRIDEADLQNQPFFREMKDAATAHEDLLYYLFEALHEWPATWDSAPRTLSGLEENSPADSRSELWLPGADLPAVGLEERKLPADFKYQGISPKVLPDVGQKWDLKNTAYAERLVADRNGAGRRFILKNETDLRGYPVGIRKNYLWRTKNNPVREYLAFKLARALGANVCDVVIPDPEERKIFTDFLGSDANASPDGVYLVRAAQDYQLADEQVKQKDSKRAFTRNFVAALAMRKYDFHYSNLAPLPDAEKVFMMFDGDQCFHLRAIDFSVFLRKFILNYFQWGGHFDGRINPNDLLKFIDPAELRAAIDEFKALDLNRLKGEVEEELRAKSLPTSQLSQIDAYFTLLEYWQRYIGEDALMFFDKLYAYPRLPTLPADPPLVFALGDIHRALSREGTTQFGAGQEEVGTLAERMPDWLRDVIPASEMADLIRAVHDKAIIGDGLIFLIQPELLDPAGKADRFNLETDLIGLNGSIRAALDLPEEADFDLGIDLLTDQNKKTYEGHRIVEVVRDPSGKNRDKPLPFEAIPLVVARAMAAARGQERYRFIIDVTPYLDVQGETLPEVLSELTDLFA